MGRKTLSGYFTPLSCLNVDVLKSFSRLMARWFCDCERDAWSVLLSLVGCCLSNLSIEEYYADYGGATPDVVLKLGDEPVERMALLCNLLLSESFRMAKRARLFDDGIFCVDYTTVYYSGRQGEYTLKVMQEAKGKKKKRRGFMYGVSCVVRPGNRYFTGVMPYKKGDGVDKTVGYLMERMLAEFSLSMFDKGFINCDAFQRLENEDKDYVLPFKRNKQLDQAWGGVDVLIEYRLRKHGGGGKLVSILLMKDEEKECGYRAFVFPLGISMEEAKKRADLYRLRWQQEIGFKCRNKVRAWTKSPSTSYRLILFTISLLVSNLWFFLKQTGNRIRQTSFRLHFFCTVLTAQVEIGDKQTVFGTKIKKVDNPFS